MHYDNSSPWFTVTTNLGPLPTPFVTGLSAFCKLFGLDIQEWAVDTMAWDLSLTVTTVFTVLPAHDAYASFMAHASCAVMG
jgi:hypothetical protein